MQILQLFLLFKIRWELNGAFSYGSSAFNPTQSPLEIRRDVEGLPFSLEFLCLVVKFELE